MRKFIKLVLLVGIICFTLINHRYLSFDNGWSVQNIDNDSSASAILQIKGIPQKIQYYKKLIPFSDSDYKIYIETSNKNYLFDATEKDLTALGVVGVFADKLTPEKITPIPYIIEIFLCIFILFFPSPKRNSDNSINENENKATDDNKKNFTEYKKF